MGRNQMRHVLAFIQLQLTVITQLKKQQKKTHTFYTSASSLMEETDMRLTWQDSVAFLR
jgi:hypothetical protein